MFDGKVVWELILKVMAVPMMIMAGLFFIPVTMMIILMSPWVYSEEIKRFFKLKKL
jgi:hypothetical protein